jgi:hypothetical protein
MKAEEFEEIITPLYLLNGKECQFLLSALRGNFERWQSAQQLATPAVIKSLSDLDGKIIPVRFTVKKGQPNIHIDDV